MVELSGRLPRTVPFAINHLVPVLDHAYPVVRDADAIIGLEERMSEAHDLRPGDDPRVAGRTAVQVIDCAFVQGAAAPLDLV